MRAHSSFQLVRMARQCRFIGAKTVTSRGCMMLVAFSGRKQNRMLCFAHNLRTKGDRCAARLSPMRTLMSSAGRVFTCVRNTYGTCRIILSMVPAIICQTNTRYRYWYLLLTKLFLLLQMCLGENDLSRYQYHTYCFHIFFSLHSQQRAPTCVNH
jgi:hypothetical protein